MKKMKNSFLLIICSSIFMLSMTTVKANENNININGDNSSTMTVNGSLAPESAEPLPDEDDKTPSKENVTVPRQQVSVDTLPKTGENQQHWLFSVIGLSTLLLCLLLVNQRKKQYEKNR